MAPHFSHTLPSCKIAGLMEGGGIVLVPKFLSKELYLQGSSWRRYFGTTRTCFSHYYDTLRQSRGGIRRKRPGLLLGRTGMLRDNASPTACTSRYGVRYWIIICIALTWYPVIFIRSSKRHSGGRRFTTEAEVRQAVMSWLQVLETDFYAGIDALVYRWKKCFVCLLHQRASWPNHWFRWDLQFNVLIRKDCSSSANRTHVT
ncbi:Uncharacterised protein r2_g298 [Pycnogonum litorale]